MAKKINLFKEVTEKLSQLDGEGGKGHEVNMPPIPEAVVNFLGKLSLLEGVPLHNLIPDARYLPVTIDNSVDAVEKGSLKFFWIDPDWIQCLLNGALSIADDTDGLMLRKAMEGKYTAEVFYNEAKEKIKRQLAGTATPAEFKKKLIARLREKGIEYENPQPTAEQVDWRYTGFFIRSSVISSWVGLEVIAYDENKQRLQVIKLERVAKNALYCICEGMVSMIEMTQPPETIHFSITPDKLEPQIVPYRAGGRPGVLDVKKTLDALMKAAEKDKKGKVVRADKPSSAAFAANAIAKLIRTELTITRK